MPESSEWCPDKKKNLAGEATNRQSLASHQLRGWLSARSNETPRLSRPTYVRPLPRILFFLQFFLSFWLPTELRTFAACTPSFIRARTAAEQYTLTLAYSSRSARIPFNHLVQYTCVDSFESVLRRFTGYESGFCGEPKSLWGKDGSFELLSTARTYVHRDQFIWIIFDTNLCLRESITSIVQSFRGP